MQPFEPNGTNNFFFVIAITLVLRAKFRRLVLGVVQLGNAQCECVAVTRFILKYITFSGSNKNNEKHVN